MTIVVYWDISNNKTKKQEFVVPFGANYINITDHLFSDFSLQEKLKWMEGGNIYLDIAVLHMHFLNKPVNTICRYLHKRLSLASTQLIVPSFETKALIGLGLMGTQWGFNCCVLLQPVYAVLWNSMSFDSMSKLMVVVQLSRFRI